MNYPINLNGLNEARETAGDELELEFSGDVITGQGELIGKWILFEDWNDESKLGVGEFKFIPDGEDKPTIVQTIGILDSPSQFGLALSRFCGEIRSHHEAKHGPID